jgi:hypothetical protein
MVSLRDTDELLDPIASELKPHPDELLYPIGTEAQAASKSKEIYSIIYYIYI